MLIFFHARFGRLFSSLDHAWLCPENLVNFTYAAYNKGGALDDCWGFIDETARACCGTNEYQRLFFICWFQEKSECFFKRNWKMYLISALYQNWHLHFWKIILNTFCNWPACSRIIPRCTWRYGLSTLHHQKSGYFDNYNLLKILFTVMQKRLWNFTNTSRQNMASFSENFMKRAFLRIPMFMFWS